MPTLVIRGNRDEVFKRAFFEDVTRSIPDAQEADIGGSGHLVMLERREAVNRAIERFVLGEQQRSWRDATSANDQRAARVRSGSRDALRLERPWLLHYEPGVPYTTAVPNIPLHHLLRSAVRRFPHNPAIFFEGGRLSYRSLNHEANRVANALSRLGVGKGKRVVLLLPNLPQMVIAFYGTMKVGATAVLIPPTIEPDEIVRQVKEADVSLLIALNSWADLARQVQTSTRVAHLVLTDAAQYLSLPQRLLSRWKNSSLQVPGALQWDRWLAPEADSSPDVDVAPDELAVIQYTGGTTGQARGVMLSHRNLVANAMQTRHWMPQAEEGRERFLAVVPFFHSYGLTTAMNVPVALGAAMILQAQFDTLHVLEAVRKYRPTVFTGVPSMYVAISHFPRVRRYGMASIKMCISGAAPLPLEVQESFEKLTKGRLVEGYGLTEASPVTHANPVGGGAKAGTIGVPLPSTEAAIFDLRRGKTEVQRGPYWGAGSARSSGNAGLLEGS